ncbi:MAG: VOC family protein [Betaproteobacteria bacterium]|nr:VOC family protein [Betaproteobacteria bacterium]
MAAIKALGIDHVVLRVTDVPRACAWYAAVLGCKIERVLPSLGLTQLRAGASLIDLVNVNGAAGKAGGAAAGRKRRNMDHFCVQIAEFSEPKIRAQLKRKGIVCGAVTSRYGAQGHGPSLYLTDPDGNTVELKGPPDTDQTEKIPDAIVRKRAAAR